MNVCGAAPPHSGGAGGNPLPEGVGGVPPAGRSVLLRPYIFWVGRMAAPHPFCEQATLPNAIGIDREARKTIKR